jgi:hypothetical protein
MCRDDPQVRLYPPYQERKFRHPHPAIRNLPQRSMMAVFPSSWRSPAAVARLFSRSICSALSLTRSALAFSSTRATRLVPGIGAIVVSNPSTHPFDGYPPSSCV